jgi:hypothetical protein
MDYKARFYSAYLNRFLQPDTMIPSHQGVQGLNRYAFVNNNPIRYNDPSGHGMCEDTETEGRCNSKLGLLLRYVDDEIVNKKGDIKQKHKGDILGAMLLVVGRAATIYRNDWDSFFDATDYVFSGRYGHGAGTMWYASRSKFHGYFSKPAVADTGFHFDFRDGSPQVRHFWVALASAADPYGDNPLGGIIATGGNAWHDYMWDTRQGDDTMTVIDYKLSVTGIDIANQIGNEIKTPSDLREVLE